MKCLQKLALFLDEPTCKSFFLGCLLAKFGIIRKFAHQINIVNDCRRKYPQKIW